MEAQKTSTLEKSLFSFTRIITIGGALIGIIILIIVILSALPASENTSVSFNEINAETTQTSVTQALIKSEEPLDMPDNVKKYLSGNNEQILQDWLNGLNNQEQKQDFIDNLSVIITDAVDEEKTDEEIYNIINNYKLIKLSKFNRTTLGKYEEMAKNAITYIIIASLVFFIALMSLILVMLAIERNTRQN